MPVTRLIRTLQRIQRKDNQQGVGMIEVMIALVLLTTTLLGATALQLTGLQTNRGAYYRTQASQLAYDIAERIRINSTYALAAPSNYSINTSSAAVPSAPNCITANSGCSAANLASQDIREWSENFFDVTNVGQDGGTYQSILPNGAAQVTASGSTFSVSISWVELDWNVGGGVNKANATKTFTTDFTLAN